MIEKKQFCFLLVLLCTSTFCFANLLVHPSLRDSVTQSEKIIVTQDKKIYSSDSTLSANPKKSQKEGIIYLQNGAILYSDKNINAKIVYVKTPPSEKKVVKKATVKAITIALEKKQKQIKIKESSKPEIFFTNQRSDQNISSGSIAKSFCSTIVSNHVLLKNEVSFHYTEINIPLYLYLEKIYSEEFSLSSEHSQSYFSRPPPSFV